MGGYLKNKKVYIPLIVILAAALFTIWFVSSGSVDSDPLFFYQNSFEDPQTMLDSDGWDKSRSTFFTAAETGRDGGNAIGIENKQANDARFRYALEVKKGYIYKLSCWMKTEQVGTDHYGGNISIMNDSYYFGDVRGTSDWTYVEGYVRALKDTTAIVWLRLGGYASENTGTVYFDDFKIEEMKKLPQGVDVNKVNTTGNTISADKQIKERQYVLGYTIGLLLLGGILYLFYATLRVRWKQQYFNGYAALILVFAAGFLIRLIAAPFARGFEGDVWLFKNWGNIMATDVSSFYDAANQAVNIADYPPFYMYVLGLVGKLMQVLQIDMGTYAYKLAVKLPPILADMMSAFIIYKICERVQRTEKGKWLTGNWKVFFAALYLFNPMVLFDSVVWGQMDSFLALFIVLALYAVMARKVTLSAILFGIAIMIKPQGLFAGPVLLYYVLQEGGFAQKVKNFCKCAIALPATIAAISFPYLIQDIWFLPKLLEETAGRYDYASVNGFNFFSLIGLNWERDSQLFLGVSYYTWGMCFLTIVVLAAGFLYMKLPKEYPGKVMLTGLFLIMGVFTFTVRMHERYLFPAILISAVVVVLDNSRMMLWIHSLVTVTSFFNALMVLGKYTSQQDIWTYGIGETLVSAGNLLAFGLITVYMIFVIRGYNSGKIVEEAQLQ